MCFRHFTDGVLYECLYFNFRLFTHYMPCKTFGCGMRVGATVFLHNVHLCKLGQVNFQFPSLTFFKLSAFSSLSCARIFAPILNFSQLFSRNS